MILATILILTYPIVKHPDDRSSLVVGNVVEDFIYLRGMTDLHLDGVRAFEGVQLQGLEEAARNKLFPDLVLRVQHVCGEVLHKLGET